MTRLRAAWVLLLAALYSPGSPGAPGASAATPAAARRPLGFRPWSLELPGPPAQILAVDLDGDRRTDLVVVVKVSEWTQKEVQDSSEMDKVKGLVDAMTVIPAVDDRREVRVFLARPEGGYRALPPMTLPLSVLAMEAGPPGAPVLALTDEGVSALRLGADGQPRLEPLIADPPVLAGTGTFVANLGLVRDLDGDGIPDLVLPARDGLAIYLGTPAGLATAPVVRLPVPGEAFTSAGELRHAYPLPQIADVNGDGRPDLVLQDPRRGWGRAWVIPNAGGGRFGEAVEIDFTSRTTIGTAGATAGSGAATSAGRGKRRHAAVERPVFLGDVDGDGVAELVTAESLDEEASGLRAGIRQANEPLYRYRFYHLDRNLKLAAQPYLTLDAHGYAFGGEELAGGLLDLGGDRRLDLVTATLDLSVWKAMKVAVTRSLTLQVDFHVWCQEPSGAFRPVGGLDLAGHFHVNLNDIKLRQLVLFADLDGDGRADFLQLGRGKEVTVYLGRPGCSYGGRPDYTFQLRDEPRDMALVQVRDLDGDGRADLLVIEPRAATDPALAPPVRLDLYLSGGAH